MARRVDDSREAVSIFSLSFLDVFACCLGALILILMMILNQVSLAFDPQIVQEKVKEVEAKKQQVTAQVLRFSEARTAALEWDKAKASMEAEIAQLTEQLKQMQAAVSQYGNITAAVLIQAKQALAAAQEKVKSERSNAGAVWFGTGNIGLKPRFIEVVAGSIIDHGAGTARQISSYNIPGFLMELRGVSRTEYPVFIIRPAGVDQWREIEDMVEDVGIPYGYEPFTAVWEPLLGGGSL